MPRKIVATLFALIVVTLPILAAGQQDFSGTWKLNVAKSDFGQIPGPASRTDVIEQSGTSIKQSVVSDGQTGPQKYTLTFTTDGKDTTFPSGSGPKLGPVTLEKISASWQGSALVVAQGFKFQDEDATAKSTYTLSGDGSVLTVRSQISGPMGELSRTMVFDKLAASAAAGGSALSTSPVSKSPVSKLPESKLLAAAAPMTASAAGEKPNLTGTWKLNASKSIFGEMPPPASWIETIDDHEPSVKIVTNWVGGPMGESTLTSNLSTDGKETTSIFLGGNEAKNTAVWDAGSLVVNTITKMQEQDFAMKSVYSLSSDRQSLTIASHYAGPMGENDMKLVFDKQP